jgi:hypothetical protein
MTRATATVVGNRIARRYAAWTVAAAALAACMLPILSLPPGIVPAGPDGVAHAAERCAVHAPVLVVGGSPAGVAAAVAAARLGASVYLTEARPYLGGDLTGPMVNTFDMDFGPHGLDLAQGVFSDIYDRLGVTFDVQRAKHVFMDEVRSQAGITVTLRTRPVAVLMSGSRVTGVTFESARRGRYTVCATRVIDATGNADVAAMAGVPYTLGRQDSGIDRAMMSATLVFELRGVNWRQVVRYVDSHIGADNHGVGVYRGNVWGYDHIVRMYKAAEPGVALYDLNIGRQDNGTVLINGLQIFGVDGTNPPSVADGMRRAKAELPLLIRFLRHRAPGFVHARLMRTARYLYIRETRHMRGLYTMTAEDIVAGRLFWDAIGVASYPIDIHPYTPGQFNPFAPRRYVYTIPFRSLVPYGTANLLMASRSISAKYAAAASLRIIPTTMEEGQAAGIAAVLSIQQRVSMPQFAARPVLIHRLQAALHDQGAYLPAATLAAIGTPPAAERAGVPIAAGR